MKEIFNMEWKYVAESGYPEENKPVLVWDSLDDCYRICIYDKKSDTWKDVNTKEDTYLCAPCWCELEKPEDKYIVIG